MRHQPPYERQVLAHLQNGPMRFKQLIAATGVPNTTSMCRTLKRLCREGIVTRTVLPDITPVQAWYALTAKEQSAE
jgi:DNA-binding HxlR family transcriptional regulator